MNGIDHLILLIGTNPLPNYVVAKYFMDKNPNLRKVWFVHSSGNSIKDQSSTKEYADNIKSVLEKNVEELNSRDIFNYVPLSDIENASDIYNELNSGFNGNLDGTIHLNYTGGTKVMGIHAYQYIKGLKNVSKEFSYLSPKIFKLVNDEGDVISTEDLRKKIELDFQDIITLHGYEEIYGNKRVTNCPFNMEEIAKFIEEGNLENFNDYDGFWLENYVHNILNEKFDGYDNLKMTKNLELRKPRWIPKFEIDILILRGYQLIGISCKKAKKKAEYKRRGFEIILRTKQISGDESKAILITLADEGMKMELQDELKIDTGGSNKNILVLGRNDLKKETLIKRITNYLNMENG